MMIAKKDKFNFIYKIIALITISVGLLLVPAVTYAQDQACGGEDPTGNNTNCPLDTWVWVLVIAALIFGATWLQKQQKLQKQA